MLVEVALEDEKPDDEHNAYKRIHKAAHKAFTRLQCTQYHTALAAHTSNYTIKDVMAIPVSAAYHPAAALGAHP